MAMLFIDNRLAGRGGVDSGLACYGPKEFG
jgi:hypothetical protein